MMMSDERTSQVNIQLLLWKKQIHIIIITYTYYALIDALSAHIIQLNLNTILYTHVEYSPTNAIYVKYMKQKTTKQTTARTT